MLVHYTFSSAGLLSDHLLGNSCPLGWPFVLIVFCLFVILVISHFGFEGGLCLQTASVPVHCFLITFIHIDISRWGACKIRNNYFSINILIFVTNVLSINAEYIRYGWISVYLCVDWRVSRNHLSFHGNPWPYSKEWGCTYKNIHISAVTHTRILNLISN